MARTSARTPRAEWHAIAEHPLMPRRALEAITRRRRQLLVHSALYYLYDDPVIADEVWQLWADQLVRLHNKFGRHIGFYDEAFHDWDASSGFHLPQDREILEVAQRLSRIVNQAALTKTSKRKK